MIIMSFIERSLKENEVQSPLFMTNTVMSPIMEEGLLIGIAIVAILIVVGIIFGVFDWISSSFAGLFDQFGTFFFPF